jgi:hypothetical protein
MAMLPPTQEASADVGSTANTNPACSAASVIRFVTTPAPVMMAALWTSGAPAPRFRVMVSTAPKVSSFSVLMTADQGVSGTAPPV